MELDLSAYTTMFACCYGKHYDGPHAGRVTTWKAMHSLFANEYERAAFQTSEH